ncbi:MAG: hypothetical protein ABSF97_08880 [Candidatus Sulfotelmatobacter sp.]|jgi:hypothetical protein
MITLLYWLFTHPLLWAVVGIFAGPYFFWRGFRLLQRKRLIMDTPRTTIASAAMGQVELTGRAVGPYALVAPLSHADCLYYRLTVESNPQGDLRKQMREMCAPLFIDDGTGILMIYPQGSELLMPPSSERSEYGKLFFAFSRYSEDNPEFAQEYSIRPGDTIFVLGALQPNPWAIKDPVSECNELSRIGPGYIGPGEADILRQEVYGYLRSGLSAPATSVSTEAFDLHPPVILMKGKGAFVISTESQRDVVVKLNWKSLVYIWGGPAITLWSLWEILS